MLTGLLLWKCANQPTGSWFLEQRSETGVHMCKQAGGTEVRKPKGWVAMGLHKEEVRSRQQSHNLGWDHQGTGGPDRHLWGQLLGMVCLWCEAKWVPHIRGQGWGQEWGKEKTGETSGDQAYQLGKSRGPNSHGSQAGFSLSHKALVASVYSSIMWTVGTWWQLKPFCLGSFTQHFFPYIFFNNTVIERLSWSNQGSTF